MAGTWQSEARSAGAAAASCRCVICHYETDCPAPGDLGSVRGNTERFRNDTFRLWRCPKCLTIHSLDPVDYQDIYRDYPLNKRRLDVFARGTLANLLRRLVRGGLQRHHAILDYGCGNGVFLDYLREKGFTAIRGYDPYVPEFAEPPPAESGFDCVVANDVIEHVDDPRAVFGQCLDLVKPGGLLYMGTADSEGVEDMADLERHVMRLHQPFHRVIISEKSLQALGQEHGLQPVGCYRRSYMDRFVPFSNYRFLDEFNKALGHNMDQALDPAAGKIVLKRPALLFYAFFGYFFPSAYEPAVLWRNPE